MRALDCCWRPETRIGTCGEKCAHDRLVRLEDGACDNGLTAVIDAVRISFAIKEGASEVRVAIVGREHQQGVSLGIGEVDWEAYVDGLEE